MTQAAGGTYQINHDDVVWRTAERDDEIVVLELSTATYLTLNGSAKVLWETLADGATTETMTAALVDRFAIPSDRAETDVSGFLSAVIERGLVVRHE
jgi:hypothetical protein